MSTPKTADTAAPTISRSTGLAGIAGFSYAGVEAGIKRSGGRDVAVVRALGPRHDAAAMFTRNRFAAAPVLWSREAIADGRIDAVVLNSGGANACTGPQGFWATHETAERAAEALDCAAGDVLVCSTGLIGEQLPLDLLLPGVDTAAAALADGPEADEAAAQAIMTTDTMPKKASVVLETPEGPVRIGGIAKGAGMLAPGLATMLVVLATDAVVPAGRLDSALRAATSRSFDRADSDGCMSTNDTVVLLASGASGTEPEPAAFEQALTALCTDLALQLIRDAEGASHDIHVRTVRAATEADALEVSRAVARSNLFKCAVFGNDPNWGRILSEVGTTAARFEPEKVGVAINGVTVCRGGSVGEDRALVDLASERRVDVMIDLATGTEEATIWTNDLTHDYVEENSAYSS